MNQRPVVVLCIDAADFEVITHLVSKGVLKTFEKMITNGVFGPLQSTIPPFTAPAWTSFFTGCYPETHGIYDFVKKEGHTTALYTLKDLRIPALWDFLKNVCILNVPMTYPAPHVNGFFVSGFPFSGDAAESFWPPELKYTIKDTFGEYPLHEEVDIAGRGTHTDAKPQIRRSTEEHFNYLVAAMEKRKEIYKYFLTEYDFDVYILEFQNTDIIQHRFWCFWDDRYIGFEAHETLYNSIERMYTIVDEIVGELLACAPDSIVFIVSDHGFGLIDVVPALNDWLSKRGLLKIKTRQSVLGMYRQNLLTIFKTLKLHRVINVVPGLMGTLKKILRTTKIKAGATEWSQSKAYSLGYPLYIYINKDVVLPEEYGTVRKEIVTNLKKDIQIEKIFSREELYRRYDTQSPDIIVKLKEYPLGEGTNLVAGSGHREKGIFIAYGPGIKKGCTVTAHVADVAPTILHSCGHPIPSYMEGRVLPLFEEGSERAKKEIKYDYTDEEKEKIQQKAKILGKNGIEKI